MKLKKALAVSLCMLFCVLLGYVFGEWKAGKESVARPKKKSIEQTASEEKEKEPLSVTESVESLPKEDAKETWIREKLSEMTEEQKAAQLFVILPEALTGVRQVIRAGETSRHSLLSYPVGGLIYMSGSLKSPEQTKEMLGNMMEFSQNDTGIPLFLCVDEEGGKVARVASNPAFGVQNVGNMREIGDSGDIRRAYAAGKEMGAYLKDLGFNVDFAPVADVLTNPQNELLQNRSFGSDAELVRGMVEQAAKGIEESGVFSCVKHFPGHGNTNEDSHNGYATTQKTLEEMRQTEFIPFQDQIEKGISFVMAGHISAPNVMGDQTPSSLSGIMLTDILRNELKFDGIIITDALNMGAVTSHYSSGEAAVMAFLAGADMLLMPQDFHSAYNAILEEIHQGRITKERLDASVGRILSVKYQLLQK